MKVLLVVLALVTNAFCKSLPEDDSVVSVYTTQPTTSGTSGASGLDIYQQIANNIAERISSPFYRFFGAEKNKTEDRRITGKPWEKIELLDEPTPTQFNDDNEIGLRDVEEISEDVLKKRDKKPEKITLFNSYLPVLSLKQNLVYNNNNDTVNDIDGDFEDGLTLDDVEPTPREGPFIFFLELIGSFIQLAWGAIQSIFPSFLSSSSSQTEQSN